MKSIFIDINIPPSIDLEFSSFSMIVNIINEVHIGFLSDSSQCIIHFDIEFRTFYRNRSSPPGSIRFTKFHLQAGNGLYCSLIILIDFFWKRKEHIFHSFKPGFMNLDRVRRHFFFGPAVDDVNLFSIAPDGRPAAIHCSITSANDGNCFAGKIITLSCNLHVFQEVNPGIDVFRIFSFAPDPCALLGSDGKDHCMIAIPEIFVTDSIS